MSHHYKFLLISSNLDLPYFLTILKLQNLGVFKWFANVGYLDGSEYFEEVL